MFGTFMCACRARVKWSSKLFNGRTLTATLSFQFGAGQVSGEQGGRRRRRNKIEPPKHEMNPSEIGAHEPRAVLEWEKMSRSCW